MLRSEFEQVVDEALEDLPPWVHEAVQNLHVVVEDWPTRVQDAAGVGVLGIYEGLNLHDRAGHYSGFVPDRIIVFMGPHLQMGLSRRALRTEIRRTVLHEIGHHLGMDDDRLHELGY